MKRTYRLAATLTVSLLLLAPLGAQTRGVTAEDYFAFESLSEPRFSPDGSTIAYRWANNLKPYNAMEPQRFTRYYDEMSSGSAVMLVRASATRP